MYVVGSLSYRKKYFYVTIKNAHYSIKNKLNSINGVKEITEGLWQVFPQLETLERVQEFNLNITKLAREKIKELKYNNMTPYEQLKYDRIMELKKEPTIEIISDEEISTVSKLKLYDHQKIAVSKLLNKNGNYGLFLEPGLGKSGTAIVGVGLLSKRFPINKVLFIGPLSVVPDYKRQFELFANYPYRLWDLTSYKNKDRHKIIQAINNNLNTLNIITINYEGARISIEDLIKLNPQVIVFDESHRCKNPRSLTYRYLYRLAQRAKHKIIMTGTPILKNILDLWSQFQLVDPKIFDKTYARYRDSYVIMGGYYGHEVIGSRVDKDSKYYDNYIAASFENKLSNNAYRVKMEEALDLPEQIFQNEYVDLEPKALKLYKDLLKHQILDLNGEKLSAPQAITLALRLQQLTGGFIKTDDNNIPYQVSTAKLDLLEEKIKEHLDNNTGKVVVFTRFIAEIEAIQNMLTKNKIPHRSLSGSTKDRGQVVKDFQENPEVKVIVCQIHAGGIGITLTAANLAIYYSLGYSLEDYEQSKARIHRIGQNSKTRYLHLLGRDTVDGAVLRALQEKKEVSEIILEMIKD